VEYKKYGLKIGLHDFCIYLLKPIYPTASTWSPVDWSHTNHQIQGLKPMKIDGNNDIAHGAFTDKTTPKEAPSDADFKHILKESVDRSKEQSTRIQPPLQPNSLGVIRLTPLSPEARQTTVERVDLLLDLLDEYRDQLADPNVTLRHIEPLLNTIAQEREHLSGILDRLPNEDGLKDIVHRTLITASLEVVKFNRGDYISA
jgi:hypothetical protein